jgi:hypothetical protein
MIYNENDVDVLRQALIGRSITSVQFGGDLPTTDKYVTTEGKVTLDDGTELLLGGNDGGCSCGAGDYDLVRLNDMPINGIMNVEVVDETDGSDRYEPDRTYRIFVLAQDQRFELAAFEGNDGNGYYGTGFWFTVVKP